MFRESGPRRHRGGVNVVTNERLKLSAAAKNMSTNTMVYLKLNDKAQLQLRRLIVRRNEN
jgi:hypothetical protein